MGFCMRFETLIDPGLQTTKRFSTFFFAESFSYVKDVREEKLQASNPFDVTNFLCVSLR